MLTFHFLHEIARLSSELKEGIKSLFLIYIDYSLSGTKWRTVKCLGRSDRTLASSKDQSPVRGARRENNDVRNGIPERKVPVIGNLSLPILPSLFSLATIHSRCEAAGRRRSIVPWHPWENRIRELCDALPQRERTPLGQEPNTREG